VSSATIGDFCWGKFGITTLIPRLYHQDRSPLGGNG
jgi:hypothetical protein